jgi:murein DD-endopeptidase MepM/ murein hydrolase activator NlpD
MKLLWLGLFLALHSAVADSRFTPVAEKLVAAINTNDQTAIQQLLTPEMQKALPVDKAGDFFRNLIAQRGRITAVGEPQIAGPTAQVRLTCEHGAWGMRLTLDAQQRIAGLYITDPPAEIAAPERNATVLQLPFREEWTVLWGGPTEKQNQHVPFRNQRRAIDLVIQDEQGRSHSGDGTRNADYLCYNKEILAPGSGTIVTVIDGVPDNTPGSMNPYAAVGNCVILQHATNEFSVLAHLQPQTIRVKPGDRVQPGQLLGRCGNSGNSSEPHLHFHLQHTAVLQDGTGIEPFFQGVQLKRGGRTTVAKELTPVQGDKLKPQ